MLHPGPASTEFFELLCEQAGSHDAAAHLVETPFLANLVHQLVRKADLLLSSEFSLAAVPRQESTPGSLILSNGPLATMLDLCSSVVVDTEGNAHAMPSKSSPGQSTATGGVYGASFAVLRMVQLLTKVVEVTGCSLAERQLLQPLMLAAAAISCIGISRDDLVSARHPLICPTPYYQPKTTFGFQYLCLQFSVLYAFPYFPSLQQKRNQCRHTCTPV